MYFLYVDCLKKKNNPETPQKPNTGKAYTISTHVCWINCNDNKIKVKNMFGYIF